MWVTLFPCIRAQTYRNTLSMGILHCQCDSFWHLLQKKGWRNNPVDKLCAVIVLIAKLDQPITGCLDASDIWYPTLPVLCKKKEDVPGMNANISCHPTSFPVSIASWVISTDLGAWFPVMTTCTLWRKFWWRKGARKEAICWFSCKQQFWREWAFSDVVSELRVYFCDSSRIVIETWITSVKPTRTVSSSSKPSNSVLLAQAVWVEVASHWCTDY